MRSHSFDPITQPAQFRKLLSCFSTGVAVVTTLDEHGRHAGMTASAISAVSLAPPLLLVCVGHESSFHPALSAGSAFALNVLAEDQAGLSEHFASRESDLFRRVACLAGPHGLPLLNGVVAHIICEPWGRFEAGDHTIFVGRVTSGESFDRMPLLRVRSRYTAPLAE